MLVMLSFVLGMKANHFLPTTFVSYDTDPGFICGASWRSPPVQPFLETFFHCELSSYPELLGRRVPVSFRPLISLKVNRDMDKPLRTCHRICFELSASEARMRLE